MRAIKSLGSNYIYVIWFMIYFGIAWLLRGLSVGSTTWLLIIYIISISIALSPLGEMILRILKNCRHPLTAQERNYLLPLFEEVLQGAREISPRLSDKIKLYIIDAMHIESFAIGRQTIVISIGAIETFTAEELEGIFAHELGHMEHGHTKAILLSNIGNAVFTVHIWILKGIFYVLQILADIAAKHGFVGKILSLAMIVIRFCIDWGTILFIHLSEIILAINSRSNVIQADSFAYKMGYGGQLKSSLYLLQKISMTTEQTLLDRLKHPDPHIALRIAHLEGLERQDEELL